MGSERIAEGRYGQVIACAGSDNLIHVSVQSVGHFVIKAQPATRACLCSNYSDMPATRYGNPRLSHSIAESGLRNHAIAKIYRCMCVIAATKNAQTQHFR